MSIPKGWPSVSPSRRLPGEARRSPPSSRQLPLVGAAGIHSWPPLAIIVPVWSSPRPHHPVSAVIAGFAVLTRSLDSVMTPICYVSPFASDFRFLTESIKCRQASERQPRVAPSMKRCPQNKKRIRNSTPKQRKSTEDKRKLNQCSYWILPVTPADRCA